MPVGVRALASLPHARLQSSLESQVASVRTFTPKASEITREWWVIDAEGMVLGRLATEVARVLRGKHKATFTPNMDCGDHVIVVNADKVVLTSDKAERKQVWRHSGFPGGIKSQTYAEALQRKPAEAVRRIQQHGEDKLPWFIYLAYQRCHSPHLESPAPCCSRCC